MPASIQYKKGYKVSIRLLKHLRFFYSSVPDISGHRQTLWGNWQNVWLVFNWWGKERLIKWTPRREKIGSPCSKQEPVYIFKLKIEFLLDFSLRTCFHCVYFGQLFDSVLPWVEITLAHLNFKSNTIVLSPSHTLSSY